MVLLLQTVNRNGIMIESRCLIVGLDVCAVQNGDRFFELRSDVTSALASGAQGTSKSP